MAEVTKMSYQKPIFIIYNPVSGQQVNQRDKIKKGLDEANIPHEFYETKGLQDAIHKAMSFQIDNYSALAGVGGDGTIYEIINGMLKREDGKKIPIWFVPNGSGNAYARNFGVNDTEAALRCAKSGEVMKMDVLRCLLDYESVEDLKQAKADIHNYLHYVIYSVDFGQNGELVRRSTRLLKSLFGGSIYIFFFFCVILEGMVWKFDIELDNGKKVFKNVDIQSLWAINSMFSIKRYIFNPTGFINDGLFEVQFREGAQTLKAAAALLDESENANHCYDILQTYRVKEMRLVNRDKDSSGQTPLHWPNIDGELPHFRNFAKIECLKHEIEVIVSTDQIYERGYTDDRIGFYQRLEEVEAGSKVPLVVGGLLAAGAAYYFLNK